MTRGNEMITRRIIFTFVHKHPAATNKIIGNRECVVESEVVPNECHCGEAML